MFLRYTVAVFAQLGKSRNNKRKKQILSASIYAQALGKSRQLFMSELLEKSAETGDEHEVTRLLMAWSGGDGTASERLFLIVYDILQRIARNHLRREHHNHTLQTTALVNEAYLKLIDQKNVNWQNRAHFFAIAAQVMRRILIDYARRTIAEKRGRGAQKISLEDAENFVSHSPDENLIALDDALTRLQTLDPQQSRVIELRYFGGLTVEETAEVLKISPRTVQREWTMARAWLLRKLAE